MPERKKNKYFHFKDSSVNILFCFVSVPNGTVRYGTVRYGTVRYGAVRYGTVRYVADVLPVHMFWEFHKWL